MRFISNTRLTLLLSLALIILFVLPLGVFSVVSFNLLEKQLITSAAEQLKLLAEKQAYFISYWLEQRVRHIDSLAASPILRRGNPLEIQSYLSNKINFFPEYNRLVFVGVDGISLADTEGPPGFDLSERPYLKPTLAGKSQISDAFYSDLTQTTIIVFAAPVRGEDHTIIGALLAGVDMTMIDNLTKHGQPGETGETFLIDKEGLLLTESRFLLDLRRKGIVTDSARLSMRITYPFPKRYDGVGVLTDYRGEKVLCTQRELPVKDWVLVVKQDYSELIRVALTSRIVDIIIAFGLITLMFVPFAVIIHTVLVRPILHLSKVASQIAQGDFNVSFPLETKNEVGQLVTSLRKMTDSLSHQMYTLEKQQEVLEAKNELLLYLSMRDDLTGLYNRRFFIEHLSVEIETAHRYQRPLSLLMLDVDYFKNINDTYGHLTGDQCLVHFALILTDSSRQSDVVARYGGEEFAICLPHTDYEAALALAERLRSNIENTPFAQGDLSVSLTASIGVAELSRLNNSELNQIDALITAADNAMYQAKNGGRNRVVG